MHIQLYEELKKDIIENYKVNDKLPSIRKLASLYNLSRTTVENAYSQLVVEGYIESYPRKGYLVEDINISTFKPKINLDNQKEKKESWIYDFNPIGLSKNTFPIKVWKRLFNKYIDEKTDLGAYPNGQGEENLRIEIAKYINKARGVNCNAHQIVIGCGFTNSMDLLAKLLDEKYDTLSIENPGLYYGCKYF
ncbi:MAG: GntR family transcriptional regulator [Aliarcobacter sp.]|nr:GntR family transcriptional regulator [Aliarcobacter sp.]